MMGGQPRVGGMQ